MEINFEIVSFVNEVDLDVMIYASQLNDGTLLMSSYESGLFEVKEKKGSYFLEKYSKLEKSTGAYTLSFEDSKGRLFLCHELKSILIYEEDDNKYILLDTILFQGFITGIIEDTIRGKLWLASQIGLYQVSQNQDYTFSIKKDTIFPVNAVNGILLDTLDNLWVSTNNGLFQYFAHSNPDSVKLRKYTIADGLQSREFFFWSVLEKTNGDFAFGGVNGINIFNPYEIKDLEIKANPTITYFEINNNAFPDYLIDAKTNATNVTQLKSIVLDYNQNDLSIGIAPLEYSDPDANEYFFQIVSGKDTIIKKGKSNMFEYPNMQPGTYTLTYNASNSDGIWFEDREKQLEIIIDPPWYLEWWAIASYILLVAAIIYRYYRFRIAQILKEEAFKRKEAEYKQLVAETETAVLRLQMNPHFIFNSMNSINSYILQKDVDTASDYLNRFARLMRMILKICGEAIYRNFGRDRITGSLFTNGSDAL